MATSSGERNSDDRGRDEHTAEGGDDLLKHASLLVGRDPLEAGPAWRPIVPIRRQEVGKNGFQRVSSISQENAYD